MPSRRLDLRRIETVYFPSAGWLAADSVGNHFAARSADLHDGCSGTLLP